MGGSIVKHGGQNPLEPARFGCKILHGKNIVSTVVNVFMKMETHLFRKAGVAKCYCCFCREVISCPRHPAPGLARA